MSEAAAGVASLDDALSAFLATGFVAGLVYWLFAAAEPPAPRPAGQARGQARPDHRAAEHADAAPRRQQGLINQAILLLAASARARMRVDAAILVHRINSCCIAGTKA